MRARPREEDREWRTPDSSRVASSPAINTIDGKRRSTRSMTASFGALKLISQIRPATSIGRAWAKVRVGSFTAVRAGDPGLNWMLSKRNRFPLEEGKSGRSEVG